MGERLILKYAHIAVVSLRETISMVRLSMSDTMIRPIRQLANNGAM